MGHLTWLGRLAAIVVVGASALGCGDGDGPGAVDASSGAADAATADAASADAPVPDAALADAALADAADPDAADPDAADPDAAAADAAPPDAAAPDASPPDASPPAPLASCLAILTASPGSPSGVYTIDPDGDGNGAAAFEVYCDMTTDGGGWTLVRRRDESAVGWHPLDDNLVGFASYGTPGLSPTAAASWSLVYDPMTWGAYGWTEYLFAYGDYSRWIVVTATNMLGGWASGSCGQLTQIERSESMTTPYSLLFCKRNGNAEDPWVSTNCNHLSCASTADQSMIYGENGYSASWQAARTAHLGANVFVR